MLMLFTLFLLVEIGACFFHPGDVVEGNPDQSASSHFFPISPQPTTATELDSSQSSAIDLLLQCRPEPPTCALWLTTRLQHPGHQVRGVVVAVAAAEGLLPQVEPTTNKALAMAEGGVLSHGPVEDEDLEDAISNQALKALRNPRHNHRRTPR